MVKYAMPKLVGTRAHVLPVLDSIKQNARDAKSITIITGYFKQSGWNLFKKEIFAVLSKKCNVHIFSDSKFFNTEYPLLYELNKNLNKKDKRFSAMVFNASEIQMLHAKVLIFNKSRNKSAIIVSSANITKSALCSNLELGIQVEVQRTSDFYENISNIVKFLQDKSVEPTKEDVNKYNKFKRRMTEHKKAKQQLEEKMHSQTKKTDNGFDDYIRLELKFEPELINMIQEYAKDPKIDDEIKSDNTGKAVKEFTKIVIEYKKIFSCIENFKLVLRIYSNILDHANEKLKLKELLEELQSLNKVDIPIEKILRYSNGRYHGWRQGASYNSLKANKSHINETMTLIETFYNVKNYKMLLQAFGTFVDGTNGMKPNGIGHITGILEALNPNFIVCNSQTRGMAKKLEQEQYKKILRSTSLKNYPKFNDIFRHMSKMAGIDMRTMDLVVNKFNRPDAY